MRWMLALLFLLVVITGCTTEGDQIFNSYNYYYPDSTENPDTTEPYTVQIAYPARNEVIETWFDWVEYPNPNYNGCRWGYGADTVVYAEVTTDIPATLVEARLFLRNHPSGSFSQYTVLPYPSGNTFEIRILQSSSSFSSSVPQDQDLAFWVSVMTEDSVNYISPTVPFRVVSRINFEMDSAPLAPAADTLTEYSYQQRMSIQWCAQTPNVDSFFVFIREDAAGEIARIAVAGPQHDTYFLDYLPLTDYSVWITAANEYGESASSDTMRLSTQEPFVPDDLTATVYSDSRVILSWDNRAYPDSVLVSRRDTLSDWTTIKSLACLDGNCPYYYNDSTATSQSLYYYRVGIEYTNGTWWGEDSIGVWIP